jgi:NAD(P)-dependent dehydrogenase (short-subunit alcohol dehydrogenase family)
LRIEGSVVLVTGANRGLGKAYVEALLMAGAAKVYAGARDPSAITDPRLTPVKLDVTSPEDVAAAAKRCMDVTILINNAGVMRGSPVLGAGADLAMREEMEVNVFGGLAMVQAFAPVLARNGGGAIANMLSMLSWFVSPAAGTYCVSKHAALAVTNAVRFQLKSQGTQVVGVYAGLVDTEMAAKSNRPKTSPRQVAERTLEGIEAGSDHVYADARAEEVWKSLGTDPTEIVAEMQQRWDQRNG